jgi:ATP-dependent RNA helicase DDX24/MAK5
VATDVAARGLDIPNIKHIIHYQVPRSTQVIYNKFQLEIIGFDF